METKNAILAILLSMAVLYGYQLLFPPPPPNPSVAQPPQETSAPSPPVVAVQSVTEAATAIPPVVTEPADPARDITVETDLYRAVITENGGTLKGFELKKYLATLGKDAPAKKLVNGGEGLALPLFFSWGTDPDRVLQVPLFKADREVVNTNKSGDASLQMTAVLPAGLKITRRFEFNDGNYLINLIAEVENTSDTALQGAPYLAITSQPLSPESGNSRYVFNGPVALVDQEIVEVKPGKLKDDGPKNFKGQVSWIGYEDTYFIIAAVPETGPEVSHQVRISSLDGETVRNTLSGPADIIAPGQTLRYVYTVYIGPKKMADLERAGHGLAESINFGWFGMVAKPLLLVINLLNGFVHNYGIAIILITIIIKLIFWPISQKGMKSMKNMQKLQPKLAKLKEKYKDNKDQLAKAQMQLYQTYKINPLGGCLPMLLQIPVFFALYRVLMQAIELRHAPFMLWITDLSAPERLMLGFDIPYLGGLPVLTILMGGTMFLQQKMTPSSSANPEMARAMMFMPVIFTFLFMNFASGLVLYYFVNNVLSMAQQYYVNRREN